MSAELHEHPSDELAVVEVDQLVDSDLQVRSVTDDESDAALVNSIRFNGVLQPLLVTPVEDVDGYFRVIAGHRRRRCAVAAGMTAVPVMIRHGLSWRADEVISMLVENLQRSGLSTGDTARAAEQLILNFDMDAASITAATGLPGDLVEQAVAVAQAPKTRALADHHQLSLVHAAALTEFEDDPEALKVLTIAAVKSPEQFDHLVVTERAASQWRQLERDKRAELEAAGVTVLTSGPGGYYPVYTATCRRLDYLQVPEREGTPITPDVHASCPGHVAHIRRLYAGGDDVDNVGSVVVDYYCDDWKAHGHEPLSQHDEPVDAARLEEQEAARAARMAAEQEWMAATEVRRAFITALFQRSKVPAWVHTEIAHRLVVALSLGEDNYASRQLAIDFLGKGDADEIDDEHAWWMHRLAVAPPSRRPFIALAAAASTIEASLNRPPNASWYFAEEGAHWFKVLEEAGYSLAPIEQRYVEAASQPRADDDD